MTHDELVDRAAKWLRNSAWRYDDHISSSGRRWKRPMKCGVVLTEPAGGCSETPDAIGWFQGGRQSVLIECKVSVADYRRDAKKPHRRKEHYGVGVWRYFLTPPGLLSEEQLLDGWGWLEAYPRKIMVAVQPVRQERHITNEMSLLWSECRKIQIVENGGELAPTKAGKRIMDAMKDTLQ